MPKTLTAIKIIAIIGLAFSVLVSILLVVLSSINPNMINAFWGGFYFGMTGHDVFHQLNDAEQGYLLGQWIFDSVPNIFLLWMTFTKSKLLYYLVILLFSLKLLSIFGGGSNLTMIPVTLLIVILLNLKKVRTYFDPIKLDL